MEPRKLVRLQPNVPREMRKAVLVGNGAIAGGAECLSEVIRSLGGKDAEIHSGLEYAVALSFYSANIRTLKNIVIHSFLRSEGEAGSFNFESNLKRFSDVNSIRTKIADAFVEANKSRLTIRPEFDKYVPDLTSRDVGIVTINWDELLWRKPNLNLVQLHGRASAADSLILPTEQIADAFILEALRLLRDSKINAKPLQELFRGHWQAELVEAEKSAFHWIASASELVIYGVAINPYDAELLQVLRQWNNMKPLGFRETRIEGKPNLTVVNPKVVHAELAARFLCVQEYLWINPIKDVQVVMSLKNGCFTAD